MSTSAPGIAWRLAENGRLLEIHKIDPVSRALRLHLSLRLRVPMTVADAQKYVDDNFPQNKSSIQLAAEILARQS